MQRSRMKLEAGNSSEASLIRELSMLKKSRSLRDPSTSPSWKSIPIFQKVEKRHQTDEPPVQPSLNRVASTSSKLSFSDSASTTNDRNGECDRLSGRDCRVKISALSGKHEETDHVSLSQRPEVVKTESAHVHLNSKLWSGGQNLRNWNSNGRSRFSEVVNAITQGNIASREGSDVVSHMFLKDGRSIKSDDCFDADKERATFLSDSTSKLKSAFRGTRTRSALKGRRSQRGVPSVRDHALNSENGLNWNSFTFLDRTSGNLSGKTGELEISSEIPQNRCGMPWTWSKIHNRGKRLLDIECRSLTCGPSNHLSRRLSKTSPKGVSYSKESTPITSETSDSSLNTDSESFPLLDHGMQSETNSPSEELDTEHVGSDLSDSTFAFTKVKERKHLRPSVLSNHNGHHSLSEMHAPSSFQDIIGQSLITQALSNALVKGRIAPTYIFHGPEGTGKSSCARIFAVALNCNSVGKLKPCGACSECLAYKHGDRYIVKELAASGLQDCKGLKKLIHETNRALSSRYKVYIVDECDKLSIQSWDALMKIVEDAPKNVVFVLCTSNLENVPHAVASRCPKYMFVKIKEIDVVNRLQKIAMEEGLELDIEALKLIASACDGSLRDAEMMLDQLSLLSQRITSNMVQELMGLVSNEKLVDLLDFALSADTVNTVRYLKDLMVSGVQPLTLMSQLACFITSLLAGGYQVPAGTKRKFFKKAHLAKEETERLRQALKILSEAEKQLRSSSDKTTWLTAALLQFAPDQSYLNPNSSGNTSFAQSPAGILNALIAKESDSLHSTKADSHNQQLPEIPCGAVTEGILNHVSTLGKASVSNCQYDLQKNVMSLSQNRMLQNNISMDAIRKSQMFPDNDTSEALPSCKPGEVDMETSQMTLTSECELDELWQRVLDVIHSSSLKKFLQTQGTLLSVSLCKGFAVAILEFSESESHLRAERSRASIIHAFQTTLGCPIDVRLHHASSGDEASGRSTDFSGDQSSLLSSLWQPAAWGSGNGKAYFGTISFGKGGYSDMKSHSLHYKRKQSLELFGGLPDYSMPQNVSITSHAVDVIAAENERNLAMLNVASDAQTIEERLETAWVQCSRDGTLLASSSRSGQNNQEGIKFRQNSRGRGHVSLGYAIHQHDSSIDERRQDKELDHMDEGSNYHLRHIAGYNGPSLEINNTLEAENLNLESRSGGLSCWKANERTLKQVNGVDKSPRRSSCLMSICPCNGLKKS
ncbi:hypothetical protein KP509_24G034100 [Ceratopteris richardii]|uniref:AAA+ ATPase domain-containing protein n=1 Tax=Ceratopteris richardii TaxID=49495 RepID=A0A8T2RWR1_CERRI|nr:hypothetical protein KP509_24G034100 [Ceratopteris richardii]KAH7299863.1 hypothetical protein KP509_24G034100 [Ceratopteris richardii]